MRAARRIAAALVVLVATTSAATAEAHVQVQPAVVAPNDPVEFTVIVPSERPAHTTRVDLKLPEGVLPFAYGETPGWRRRLVTAQNGAVERVVWTGRLAEDGYARFTFLAGTPGRPGPLTWKALQTYDDGTVARWIGSPDAESPAPVVRVEADAPRQNAGGEGARAADAAGGGAGDASTRAETAATTASTEGAGPDWLARGLGLAGLVVAAGGAWTLSRRVRRV